MFYKEKTYTAAISDDTILDIKKYFSENVFKGKIPVEKMKIIFRKKIIDDKINLIKEGFFSRKTELFVIE